MEIPPWFFNLRDLFTPWRMVLQNHMAFEVHVPDYSHCAIAESAPWLSFQKTAVVLSIYNNIIMFNGKVDHKGPVTA